MGPKKGKMIAKNHIGITTGSLAKALLKVLFVLCTPMNFSHTKYRGVQANPNVMNCKYKNNKNVIFLQIDYNSSHNKDQLCNTFLTKSFAVSWPDEWAWGLQQCLWNQSSGAMKRHWNEWEACLQKPNIQQKLMVKLELTHKVLPTSKLTWIFVASTLHAWSPYTKIIILINHTCINLLICMWLVTLL